MSARQKPKGRTRSKALVRPSRKSITEIYDKLCSIVDQSSALSQSLLIKRLNSVIRGWAQYHRSACSAETFSKLDHLLYRKLRRWCHRRHTRKAKGWIVNRYWNGGKPWQFRDADTGAILRKFTDTHIRRHVKIRATAHFFDGNDTYWDSRNKTRAAKCQEGQSGVIPAPLSSNATARDNSPPDLWR